MTDSDPQEIEPAAAIFQRRRGMLITAISISMIGIGISLLSGGVAIYEMSNADEHPYRVAAALYLKVATGACGVGMIGLFVLLVGLRPIFRQLLVEALTAEALAKQGGE